MDGPVKQKEVKHFLQVNKVGLACLLETKMKREKFGEVHDVMFQNWCLATNFSTVKGGRILVAWLDSFFQLNVIKTHPQFIHAKVRNIALNLEFFCSSMG